jgi:hypothetical protein
MGRETMSETLWRIIYVLHVAFGVVSAALMLAGGLVFVVPAETREDRMYKRFITWVFIACGIYWGIWLIRWVATGLGPVPS